MVSTAGLPVHLVCMREWGRNGREGRSGREEGRREEGRREWSRGMIGRCLGRGADLLLLLSCLLAVFCREPTAFGEDDFQATPLHHAARKGEA